MNISSVFNSQLQYEYVLIFVNFLNVANLKLSGRPTKFIFIIQKFGSRIIFRKAIINRFPPENRTYRLSVVE